MKFSRKKHLEVQEEKPVVRIPDIPRNMPVVAPIISRSERIQEAHVRVYDDHATMVNAGRPLPADFRPILGPIKPRPVISPIKLPEKPRDEQKALITEVEKPPVPGSYDEYTAYASAPGIMMEWDRQWEHFGGGNQFVGLVKCPLCGEGSSIIIHKEFKDIPSSLTTNVVCHDCWDKYLHNGILLMQTDDNNPNILNGQMVVMREEAFKEIFSEALKKAPNILKYRTALIPKRLFDEIGITKAAKEGPQMTPKLKKQWGRAEKDIGTLKDAKDVLDEMIAGYDAQKRDTEKLGAMIGGEFGKEVIKELRKSDAEIEKLTRDLRKSLDDLREVGEETNDGRLKLVADKAGKEGFEVEKKLKFLREKRK